MLAALVLALSVVPSSAQNTGLCNPSDACPWRCCRGTPGDSRCWCSRCCVVKGQDLGPDDRAQTVEVDGRLIAAYRRRVEFRRAGDEKPRRVRRFVEGVLPLEPDAGRDGYVMVCTSAELGVAPDKGALRSFCGAYDLDGREVFRLREAEGEGVTREPVGVRPGGREALFALTRSRGGGEREIVGYRLWSRGRPSELLPADGPRTRRVLEGYEGRLTLPSPEEGH